MANNNQNKQHIQLAMIFKMAVANLKFKRFRSFVTVLGVTIGIGSIYLLLSFGLGLQNLVKGEVVGNKSIETIDVTSPDLTLIRFSSDNINKMKSVNNVTDVSGMYILAGQAKLDSSSLDAVIYGVDSLYKDLSDLQVTSGKFIDTNSINEVVIGKQILDSLNVSDTNSIIGKNIHLSFTPFGGKKVDKDVKVVGVTDSQISGLEVFVSQKLFSEAGATDFDQAKIVVNNRDNISDVRRSVESFGFDTTSPIDTLEQVNQVFKVFNLILAGLGGIGLVIAVLGMLNTLTISLLERTKEIALMLTIGARPQDMKRLFTVEAMLLSFIGGMMGVFGATILGLIVNLVLNQLSKARGISYSFNVFYNSFLLILGMLLLMLIIGFVVSYVPARRAARINSIEALRHE